MGEGWASAKTRSGHAGCLCLLQRRCFAQEMGGTGVCLAKALLCPGNGRQGCVPVSMGACEHSGSGCVHAGEGWCQGWTRRLCLWRARAEGGRDGCAYRGAVLTDGVQLASLHVHLCAQSHRRAGRQAGRQAGSGYAVNQVGRRAGRQAASMQSTRQAGVHLVSRHFHLCAKSCMVIGT